MDKNNQDPLSSTVVWAQNKLFYLIKIAKSKSKTYASVVLGRDQLERQGQVESEDIQALLVPLVSKVYQELLGKRVER